MVNRPRVWAAVKCPGRLPFKVLLHHRLNSDNINSRCSKSKGIEKLCILIRRSRTMQGVQESKRKWIMKLQLGWQRKNTWRCNNSKCISNNKDKLLQDIIRLQWWMGQCLMQLLWFQESDLQEFMFTRKQSQMTWWWDLALFSKIWANYRFSSNLNTTSRIKRLCIWLVTKCLQHKVMGTIIMSQL